MNTGLRLANCCAKTASFVEPTGSRPRNLLPCSRDMNALTAIAVVREMVKLIAPLGVEWKDSNDAEARSDMNELSKATMFHLAAELDVDFRE